jgi:excinuclease ABC subunit A
MPDLNLIPYTPPADFESLDPRQYIIIKGARANNLKNIDVAIPRNQLVVITGLSGSGKSSLAFDTLFAEGQRMYVESLSSYARQFMGRMEKPAVDYIKGISPAIAIEQKVNTRNPRSTVGTSTEIYDYLKLLFARIGVTYSPVSGSRVRKDTVSDVVDFVLQLPEGERFMVLCPLVIKQKRTLKEELKILLQKGFTRIVKNDELLFIEDYVETLSDSKSKKSSDSADYFILIDRAVVVRDDEDARFRLADSVQTAFFESDGICVIKHGDHLHTFSDKFEADGILFEEPSVNLFSFNNPYGACKTCEGFGHVLGIDPDLVIPDKNLSVYEGAIAPWRSEGLREEYLKPLLKNGIKFDFPIHRAYSDLTEDERKLLWTGNTYFTGLNDFFQYLESQSFKIQYRVLLSRYRGRTICPDCRGSRLRKDAGYVKIGDKSIIDLSLMPIAEVAEFFRNLQLTDADKAVSKQLLTEITNRLEYMEKVGLGYLTLHRLTNTLSGGEFQRIKLATSLGSALVGSMYILDEPSIGLHPRDTTRLVEVLRTLKSLGNTVIVVEHEEEVIKAADLLIDIGPEAGSNGGKLVFQGRFSANGHANGLQPTHEATQSHTFRYLTGEEHIEVPKTRRKWFDFVEIIGAREHNLKNLKVKFPLGVLTVVTGVSGSGKSTLVSKILTPALMKMCGLAGDIVGKYDKLGGAYNRIKHVELVDQNPIGKSSRSNPITYIKAYDPIRQLFAEQPLAQLRGYTPAYFSFNVEGGRCEICQGEGEVTIEMQFMADIHLTCEACGGRRFKQEVLEVKYKDKSISDVLSMTVDDAMIFFSDKPKIKDKIKPLADVGLGYLTLGQSSSTLSGGEAQRVKLAYFLGSGATEKGTFFVFDEPTTGLHFHDINKLLKSINALVDNGHTVLIIEHNMEVIKCADWVIDLGPDGGDNGGFIVFEGTPDDMVLKGTGYTAEYLKAHLKVH